MISYIPLIDIPNSSTTVKRRATATTTAITSTATTAATAVATTKTRHQEHGLLMLSITLFSYDTNYTDCYSFILHQLQAT